VILIVGNIDTRYYLYQYSALTMKSGLVMGNMHVLFTFMLTYAQC